MFTVKGIIAACMGVLSDGSSGIEICGRLWKRDDLPALAQRLSVMPPKQFRAAACELMKTVCSRRLPHPDCVYFRFEAGADCGYSFHGKWSDAPRGNAGRIPTAVDSARAVSNARELLGQTLYVLETTKELSFWQSQWHGVALIPELLAKRAYPFVFTQRAK